MKAALKKGVDDGMLVKVKVSHRQLEDPRTAILSVF
jgi:hypothetical protein